jgi:hypothetical protein
MKRLKRKGEKSFDVEPGRFRQWLGKSEDEPITNADIEKGLNDPDPHVRKMANLG